MTPIQNDPTEFGINEESLEANNITRKKRLYRDVLTNAIDFNAILDKRSIVNFFPNIQK